MKKTPRQLSVAARLALLLMLLSTVPSCGYTLVGRGAFLPEYIQTVAIPTFVNRTSTFEVEIRLTDAVATEFISRGNFRVIGEAENADAVLRGEITGFLSRPVQLDVEDQARLYQITIMAAVTFTDLVQNKVLFTNNSFLFRGNFALQENPGQFFDVSNIAIDLIAEEFARSVVASILEGF